MKFNYKTIVFFFAKNFISICLGSISYAEDTFNNWLSSSKVNVVPLGIGINFLPIFDIIIKLLKFLSKKNKVDLVCLSNKIQKQIKQPKICNTIKVFKIGFVKRFINTIISLLKIEPLQVGFYSSKEMKKYINEVHSNYNTIICHTIRSSQYLPENFEGKKILEMTDLLSLNFKQIFQELNMFNPLKYIYWLETVLLQKYSGLPSFPQFLLNELVICGFYI